MNDEAYVRLSAPEFFKAKFLMAVFKVRNLFCGHVT